MSHSQPLFVAGRHINTLLRTHVPMYKKLRRIFSHGYFALAHERSGVETD